MGVCGQREGQVRVRVSAASEQTASDRHTDSESRAGEDVSVFSQPQRSYQLSQFSIAIISAGKITDKL